MTEKLKKFNALISVDECKGCGRCVDACPKALLSMIQDINSMGYPFAGYCGEGCIGCGACFYACPEPGAITIIEEDDEKPDPENES